MRDTTYSESAEFAKKSGHTKAGQTSGTKQLKQEFLRAGQPSDQGFAPPSRLYTRDYRVPDADDATNQDTVTPFLGNPINW